MTTTPSAPRSFISPRSRRLRTVGLLLLIAAVGMTLYGVLALMPAIQKGTHTVKILSAGRPIRSLPQPIKERVKAAAAQAIFAYAYWTVCALMIVALILVAWLDVREVQRRYIDQRIALFAETAQSLQRTRADKPD